jgi:outer membrane protein assembly factor BamC
MMNTKVLISVAALFAMTACTTTFEGNKVDYKSKGTVAPSLEVPPDLTQITKNAQAIVPVGGAANASSFQTSPSAATATTSGSTAINKLGDVRVVREGTQRWLVVDRAPDALWDEVKKFWIEGGHIIEIDQANLGIMETEWNENRAKIPQDWFARTIGKAFSGLLSSNQRDKYRTRMERTASGGTEIYISHRGMEENFTSSDKTQLRWMPRPVDPELEVEFLKRLMVRLGGSSDAAKAALDKPAPAAVAAPTAGRAKMMADGAKASLLVDDAFDQAWRRVGLSLDRTNFTVEDRDRSKGIYFVRYAPPNAEKNAPGFFARMFGAKTSDPLQKYQILVTAQGAQTKVLVASVAGVVLDTADTKMILKVLADDLQ